MLGTRYEEYRSFHDHLPFILSADLERTPFQCSREKNWHENPEIQLCTDGHGTVLLNGETYDFYKNDIIVVNSNVIHYTGTDDRLFYTCLIIKSSFCKQMGIDYDALYFSPRIVNDAALLEQLHELRSVYEDSSSPFRTAHLNEILLRLLIGLAENHSISQLPSAAESRALRNVKAAIRFIRENYDRKITLDACLLYTSDAADD